MASARTNQRVIRRALRLTGYLCRTAESYTYLSGSWAPSIPSLQTNLQPRVSTLDRQFEILGQLDPPALSQETPGQRPGCRKIDPFPVLGLEADPDLASTAPQGHPVASVLESIARAVSPSVELAQSPIELSVHSAVATKRWEARSEAP